MSPKQFAAFAATYEKMAAQAKRIFERMMKNRGMACYDLESIEFNAKGCQITSLQRMERSEFMEREWDYISIEEILAEVRSRYDVNINTFSIRHHM